MAGERDAAVGYRFLVGARPSLFIGRKAGNNTEVVRQIAVLMDIADYAQGLGGQISAQRNVVKGSPTLEANALW